MPKFEYKTLVVGDQLAGDLRLIQTQAEFIKLGQEGWELVAVNGNERLVCFFKRQQQ
jgi:hypothetical protein